MCTLFFPKTKDLVHSRRILCLYTLDRSRRSQALLAWCESKLIFRLMTSERDWRVMEASISVPRYETPDAEWHRVRLQVFRRCPRDWTEIGGNASLQAAEFLLPFSFYLLRMR
jgi:hypothetical protein